MCFYNGKHRKYGSYKSTENKKQMFFVPLEPTKKKFQKIYYAMWFRFFRNISKTCF